MKITAGLGTIDDYIPYAEAGADEFFCGYVPYEWMKNGGLNYPLNRREVLYYNVQIGSESEMEILAELVKIKKVPVTVALNSLFYAPHQYPMIAELVRRLFQMGFCSFIVADPALLVYLGKTVTEPVEIHISGEMAEVNHAMIEEVRQLGAKRIIFHRKVTPEEMKRCIEWERMHHPDEKLEYEAFALNEMCHFTGAFCSCLHCDELAPTCRITYRLIKKEDDRESGNKNDNEGETESGKGNEKTKSQRGPGEDIIYMPGQSGCGLCALWRLRDAGVTHLKLVSRGNYTADTIEDIRCLKTALHILENSSNETDYIYRMKKKLFVDGCSHNCYYL